MSDTENLNDNSETAVNDQQPTEEPVSAIEELPVETEVERFNKKNELENKQCMLRHYFKTFLID